MRSGNVVKVYRDRVDVDQIVKDASTIDVSPAERLARALPFHGNVLLPGCRAATTCRTAGSFSTAGSRAPR